MWDSVPPVIPLVEKIIVRVVASVQAENGKNATINLLSYIVPSQMVSKKMCLLSNYISYIPLFISILNFFLLLEMILSLESALVPLMREIALTVNNSQFNFTGLQEKMQLVIEHTLKAAQQVSLLFSFGVLTSLSVFHSVCICMTIWHKGQVETF